MCNYIRKEESTKEEFIRRKDNPIFKIFNDDYDRQNSIMKKFGFSHISSNGGMYLNKIKQEKYKSLEEKCIDLKKLLSSYIFEPNGFSVTEIVFDFAMNKENQFVLLQIKDYKCISIKKTVMQKTLSVEVNKDKCECECEGIVCKFAKDKQVTELANILSDIGLLPRRYCKIGKHHIKQKTANMYIDDSIQY